MKPWYRSKIIWLNVAAGGAAAAALGWQVFADSTPLPKWLVFTAGVVVAAANAGLRFVTSDSVTMKRIDQQDGFEE